METAPPRELAPGIFRLSIPMPGPLAQINVYLLRSGSGWTVIDTGYHTPETERIWDQALSGLGLSFHDIEQIVVTHYHPDHMGCAGWLQSLSGAPVIMLDQEASQVERFWKLSDQAARDAARLCTAHGLPQAQAEEVARHQILQAGRVHPLPVARWVREGDTLPVGTHRFEVIWAPGHSDGLMVLWEPDEGLAVVDDLILSGITPNVSLQPGCSPQPLADFLASVHRIGQLPARLVLPGHRQPIASLSQRAVELADHHARRLEEALAAVQRSETGRGLAPTGWEVSRELFGEQPDAVNIRFALGETLAHLEYLVALGRLKRLEEGAVVRYGTR